MFTLNNRHYTGRQIWQKLSLVLGLTLGGMGFAHNAQSQGQAANSGTEPRAAIQSPSSASGQSAATDPATTPLLSPTQLEDLVARMALYPDDLIGIILPASTYPLQVVQAVRYLKQHEEDPDLQVNAEWDDSIVALLNYPEVLQMMDADLDWTWDLGATVLNQEAEVMNAIQRFRQRALASGNLVSDDKQTVSNTGGVIEIKLADPEVIYIPNYEPEEVIVYQPRPVYRYYPVAYPVYYYPYEPDYYRFRSRSFWGLQSAFYVGWDMHCINVFPYDYYRHPYYGSTFYLDFYWNNYRRPHRRHRYDDRDINVNISMYDQYGTEDHRWRPDRDGGDQRLFNHDGQRRQRSGTYNRRWADQQLQQGINNVSEDPIRDRDGRTDRNADRSEHRGVEPGAVRPLTRPAPVYSAPRVEEPDRSRANRSATVQSMPRSRSRDITDGSAVRTLTRPAPINSAPRVDGADRSRTNRPPSYQSSPRTEPLTRIPDNIVRSLSRPAPIDSAPRVEETGSSHANQAVMSPPVSQPEPAADAQNRTPGQDADHRSRSGWKDNARRHFQ